MKRLLVFLLACMLMAGSAVAGTAYYGGFPDDTGELIWASTGTIPVEDLVLTPQLGSWTIGSYSGTPVGVLSDATGTAALLITDGNDYAFYAGWDIPEPNAYVDPATSTPKDGYLYFGVDAQGLDTNKYRLGIEWKGTPRAWYVRAQNLAVDVPVPADIAHLDIKVSKDMDGDTVFTPGETHPAVFMQYSVDFGAWTNYTHAFASTIFPLDYAGLGYSDATAPDRITFKVRGLGSSNVDPYLEGTDVPDMNIAADYDGDGVTNFQESLLGTDPTDPTPVDTDGDGAYDGDEVFLGTDPADDADAPGIAYYGGFPDDTGELIWASTGVIPVEDLVLTPQLGSWTIGSYSGTPIGALSDSTGAAQLLIPDGNNYIFHAGWDIPEPNAYVDPATSTPKDGYLYFGVDAQGFDTNKYRLGIEWKGTPRAWYVRAQNLAVDVPVPADIAHLDIKVSKDMDGDTVFTPGETHPAVFMQYSVDFGAWTNYTHAFASTIFPLDYAGLGYSDATAPDRITFKVRGLGSSNVDPYVMGIDVPEMNTAADYDGDGLTNYEESVLGTDAASVDTDGDGISDGDEAANGLDPLTSNAGLDSDADGVDDADEVFLGTDPLDNADVPGTAYYGGFPDDTGELIWVSTGAIPVEDLVLTPQLGSWTVGSYSGTPIGALSDATGATELLIPDGNNYIFHAGWDIPEPNAYVDPATSTPKDGYLYFGVDAQGFDTNKYRLGIEWKGTPRAWYVRAQNLAVDVPVPADIAHLDIKVSKDMDGDTVFTPGEIHPAVFMQYSVDFGAWTNYTHAFASTIFPLDYAGLGYSDATAPDRITFKVRGLGSSNVDPYVMGIDVPEMNTAADYDGDGLTNMEESLLGTDAASADTDDDGIDDADEINVYHTDPVDPDSDDDDISDGDETAVYGTDPLDSDSDDDGITDGDEVVNGLDPLVSNVGVDSDDDGLLDVDEIAAGADPFNPDTDGDGILDGADPDPLVPAEPEVPAAGGAGLALLGLGLATAALRRFRSR